MNLDNEQLEFIQRHGIYLSRVLDAQGKPPRWYRPIMKAGGYEVAVGVTRCIRGHSLRTRGGHCVQCNPASLAFQRRHDVEAYVYVAYPRDGNLIKIGFTGDLEGRKKSLNSSAYAGYTDWLIGESVLCENAGSIEARLHSALELYRVSADYFKQGEYVDCREVFDCSFERAISELRAIVGRATADPDPIANLLFDMIELDRDLLPQDGSSREQLTALVMDTVARLPEESAKLVSAYYGLADNEPTPLIYIGVRTGQTERATKLIWERALVAMFHWSGESGLQKFILESVLPKGYPNLFELTFLKIVSNYSLLRLQKKRR